MTGDTQKDLLNASGFALQLALEHQVRSAKMHSPWRVVASEYPWTTDKGPVYIDLILQRDNVILVIECKRVQKGAWLFLMPDQKQFDRRHARVRWLDKKPHRADLAGWGDVQIEPTSPESVYCSMRKGGDSEVPMLERIAALLSRSVEAVTSDLLTLDSGGSTMVIVPVIVTTAMLSLASFDPGDVNLETGMVNDPTFSNVPLVRFRKSLGPTGTPDYYNPIALKQLSDEAVRTVFVVTASHFVQWLSDFEVNWSEQPWVSARTASDAGAD